MPSREIPKLYYSVSEVADLTDVKPHVLRFWEKEFPMLRPKRGSSGNRSYRAREIRIIRAIKRLLYDEKYTIQGAVERLRHDRSLWDTEDEVSPAPKAVPTSPAKSSSKALSQTGANRGEKDLLMEVRGLLVELKQLFEREG